MRYTYDAGGQFQVDSGLGWNRPSNPSPEPMPVDGVGAVPSLSDSLGNLLPIGLLLGAIVLASKVLGAK